MDPEKIVAECMQQLRFEGVNFDLDDPFENSGLVTTAFLDIEWQDDHGNAALMLAAAENRVMHVKGILTMAMNNGKLWKIIDMQNNEGLNCVEMAVRAGSETCAMLITKVAREYAKYKPRDVEKASSTDAHEEDVTFELGTKTVEKLDETYVRELVRRSASTSGHGMVMKKLTREKISNSLSNKSTASNNNNININTNINNNGSVPGHEYLKMVKRSRSAHSRLMSQRTFSVESESTESPEPTTPALTLPPQDHGVFSSVGEKIRNIFGKKPPIHSQSLSTVPADRVQTPTTRSFSVASKSSQYHSVSEEDNMRLPQHTSDSTSGVFRFSKEKPLNAVSTPNGVRLPPLSLRRRANSDTRNFSSLGD